MNLWFDLKYAWRLLLKSPGHGLLCVGIVALSVGLSLSVYSIVYNMGFRSLGFPGSDRWYTLNMRGGPGMDAEFQTIDTYTYRELIKRSSPDEREIKHLGAIRFSGSVLNDGLSSQTLSTGVITSDLLKETRVAPLLGRLFTGADAEPGSTATVILSYDAWQNYFLGDPNIVGQSARIDATPTQIVGVMPKGFSFFMKADLWRPLASDVVSQPTATMLNVAPIVQLNGELQIDAVEKIVNTFVDEVSSKHPEHYKRNRRIEVVPVGRATLTGAGPIITMDVLVAVAVVLLGCVNIGTLLFARMLERSQELALRNALGSSRWRLIRQSLAESSIIALLGLLIGIGVGALGINRIQHGMQLLFAAQNQQMPFEFRLGIVECLFALLVTAVIWLSSTLLPTLYVSKQDAATVLSGSNKGSGMRRGAKSTSVLVGSQIVISCFLLVICGTLVVGLDQLAIEDHGVEMDNVIVSVSGSRFTKAYADETDRVRYTDELQAAIQMKVAGAEAAFTTTLPAARASLSAMDVESQATSPKREFPMLPIASVSENYFQLLGVALRSGRGFDASDNAASMDVAIVDEKFAQRFWPGEDPLGKRIQLNPDVSGTWLTIVGVVSNIERNAFEANRNDGTVFRPLRQQTPDRIHLVAKVPNASANVRSDLAAAALALDRDLPLEQLQPLALYVKGLGHIVTMAIGLFVNVAFITSFLAATGLYGVISRSVVQRTQEIGVRRALGASKRQVVAVFMRQGVVHLVLAIVLGGGLGIFATNLLATLLRTSVAHAILVSVCVFAGLTLVVLVSSYLPTRRAIALEPGDALRYE